MDYIIYLNSSRLIPKVKHIKMGNSIKVMVKELINIEEANTY